ncbi:1,4-alpha-glucan branching protein [Streptomyces sp. V3I7]|uniref:maltokinase N-terminal cap-like domain-containing protein n=1 Tax=Streptomyces sp. V3I7 TaxID=3042278 RepID=UPI00277F367E|nr:1,4-alpha-glucan branching protein [Streptomyces sp. V3I7]MDQ0988878.1 hypothetical protein [Streptomyces sp. V3I7]
MAMIHRTTMNPTKLELLQPWLPAQPWYVGQGGRPVLSRVGGFRLDDPEGEVGIEFMVVADESGDEPVAYHVPLTYRAAPLDGADDALLGTSEHGVLGTRWIYDGTHDPVLVATLFALLQGDAEPQAQGVSDTPDPSVTWHFAPAGGRPSLKSSITTHGSEGTELRLETIADGEAGKLIARVTRVLRPDAGAPGAVGQVTTGWRLPDGTEQRGAFVVVHDASAA